MITIFKMIGWFFIEIYELLTGKRKFMDFYNPDNDSDLLDDDIDEPQR